MGSKRKFDELSMEALPNKVLEKKSKPKRWDPNLESKMGIKQKYCELFKEALPQKELGKRSKQEKWEPHLKSIPEEEIENLAMSIPKTPRVMDEQHNIKENFETNMLYYKEIKTCQFLMFNDVMKSLYLRLLYHLNDFVEKRKIMLSQKELNTINFNKGWLLLQCHLKLKIVIIAYVDELKIKGYPTTENMNEVIQEEIMRYYNEGLISPAQSLFTKLFQKQKSHKHKMTSRGRKIKGSSNSLLDVVENRSNSNWNQKMVEVLKDIRQRTNMGQTPTGFQNYKNTLLAQIFWLEYGLKKREEEDSKLVSLREYLEACMKKKKKYTKLGIVVTSQNIEYLYLKLHAQVQKAEMNHNGTT